MQPCGSLHAVLEHFHLRLQLRQSLIQMRQGRNARADCNDNSVFAPSLSPTICNLQNIHDPSSQRPKCYRNCESCGYVNSWLFQAGCSTSCPSEGRPWGARDCLTVDGSSCGLMIRVTFCKRKTQRSFGKDIIRKLFPFITFFLCSFLFGTWKTEALREEAERDEVVNSVSSQFSKRR